MLLLPELCIPSGQCLDAKWFLVPAPGQVSVSIIYRLSDRLSDSTPVVALVRWYQMSGQCELSEETWIYSAMFCHVYANHFIHL